MDKDTIYLGTELKLNISVDQISGYTMDDYDFTAEFYCFSNRRIQLAKDAFIRSDENNYVAVIDTRSLGAGAVKCKVTAYIPDSDCADGLRTEVCVIDTGLKVVGA